MEAKCTLELASGCGRGGLFAPSHILSLHLQNVVYTSPYDLHKHKAPWDEETRRQRRDRLSIISHLCCFVLCCVAACSPSPNAVLQEVEISR